MKTKVLLFGMLADEAKRSVLEIEDAHDTDTLLSKVIEMNPSFVNFNFITAVNKIIISVNIPINENDTIALLPPYAGG